MKKPIEDKSPLAAWATLARDEAQMSVEEVVDALAARGHAVRAATIRGIEGGSKGAGAKLRRLLADVYGVNPPGHKEPATPEGMAGLIAALAAQTAAISELVSELREARGVSLEVRERVAAIEAYAVEHELRLQADRRLRGLEPEPSPLNLDRPTPVGQ